MATIPLQTNKTYLVNDKSTLYLTQTVIDKLSEPFGILYQCSATVKVPVLEKDLMSNDNASYNLSLSLKQLVIMQII